jgi:hypothetical protein
VIRRNDGIVAVEAKAGDTRGQISRSARSFVDAYAPKELLVVHQGDSGEERVGETTVRFVRLQDVGPALVRR